MKEIGKIKKTIDVVVDLDNRDSEGIPNVKCKSGTFKFSLNDKLQFNLTVKENGKQWTWEIADITASLWRENHE